MEKWYPNKPEKKKGLRTKKVSVPIYWYRNPETPTSTSPKVIIDYEEMVREFEERLQELVDFHTDDGDKVRLTIEWNR